MARRETSRTNSTTYPYFLTRVVRTRRVTKNLARITLSGEGLDEFPRNAPDQWVKLFFPRPGLPIPQVPTVEGDDVTGWYQRYLAMPDALRPVMRTYTVRAHRPERAELDIEFVLHGDTGPATRWAASAQPGDSLGVLACTGAFAPPETAPWLLLAGDHTALPAIATISESLDPVTRALVYVELDDPADEQPLAAGRNIQPRWIHRTKGAAPGDALVEALRGAAFPPGTPYAWLAGEAGLVRTLRRYLVNDRGLPKKAITFVGYWRLGKTDSDPYTEEELAEASSLG